MKIIGWLIPIILYHILSMYWILLVVTPWYMAILFYFWTTMLPISIAFVLGWKLGDLFGG